MKRMVIVGNGGGGKTTLARAVSAATGIPVCHVDSLQFPAGRRLAPRAEVDAKLRAIERRPCWIIEGLGGRDAIIRRVRAADTVVFIDFPLPVHYWRAACRQWRSRSRPRLELPPDFGEFTLSYTWQLATGIWRAHRFYRKWLTALIVSLPPEVSVHHLRRTRQLAAFCKSLTNSSH